MRSFLICLLLGASVTSILAATPPAGTLLPLNNIGTFDAASGKLQSCVALLDAQGKPLLDANGKPQAFDVQMVLKPASMVFALQNYNPFTLSAGKDCSGTFRNGVYSDKILAAYAGSALDGSVLSVAMDVQAGALDFKLRTDAANFSTVRNLNANTTALGGNLGDFQQSATREYGTANLPATIPIRLPQCNDPQGDATLAVLEKDGKVMAAASPGANFPLATSTLGVGSYQFRSYCNDETGVRSAAQAAKLTPEPRHFAISGFATGTLTIKIVQGTATSTPGGGSTGELNFQFAAATSDSDQQLIRQAATFARDFFTATFGVSLQRNAAIQTSTTAQGCASGGAAAFTGPQTMTICTANQGWTVHGPVTKQKVIIHEMFHLLQFETRWLGGTTASGPHWLIEGAAEYVGWLGIANQSLLPLATVRGCLAKEVADFAQQQPPGLPNLSALETPQQFNAPGPAYSLAMLGVDQLVAGAGESALLSYGNALAGGTVAAQAFATAFNTTTAAFYGQFPAYRAALPVPTTYQCRL